MPLNGTLSGDAPTVTYTPGDDFEGTDTFTFTVSDGELTSEPAVVTIMVTQDANVAPEFIDPTPADGTVLEVVEGSEVSFTLAAQDADEGPMALELTLTGVPEGATFDAATGVFSWTPGASDVGTVNMVASAGDGLDTVTRTIGVKVTSLTAPEPEPTPEGGCCATVPQPAPRSPLGLFAALLGFVALLRRRD